MEKAEFGMIGLGVMGRNFLLNVADSGFSCVGYDLDAEKRSALLVEGSGTGVETAESISSFIEKLARPRNIMLLVPAGSIVDSVINDLLPYLEHGDLVIDGGNSHFTDTERREAFLSDKGFDFMGVGVSGGEEGARHGASIMPGGKPIAFERVRPILETVAAKVGGEPCVAYVGESSAGHFVKMVHNGIEYGLMQLLAETYDLMHRALGMNYAEMSRTFAEWNRGELNSFLVEITSQVLRKADPKTGKALVEMILDTAGQKGTGKWTSQAAMDFGIPVPTIDIAVTMRQISSFKNERVELSAKYPPHNLFASQPSEQMRERILEGLKNALHAAFIITYAQGMSLLHEASIEKKYGLNLSVIAKIWRGGCIIRAALLEQIRQAFDENPQLTNLLLNDTESLIIGKNLNHLRDIVTMGFSNGIPVAAFASTLSYLDAYTSRRLPANLIQAQRDFFGAHTYRRIDEEGTFHTPDWDK
ncbi:MAG TPA: NADP-dependent phosphogluconate dehydrogenase [Pyrinomonadaceae bacterium]|nr:NADP-dependent phosphogluconate dehydrogenase [Pyrinomonadaceae bacterium]